VLTERDRKEQKRTEKDGINHVDLTGFDSSGRRDVPCALKCQDRQKGCRTVQNG